MQTSEVIALTIIISTTLILLIGGTLIYFLFLYQRKRYRHQQEVLELREAFNQTLLQSKLEIQEQTLDHISKELHANFSHLVSLININLSEILPQSSSEIKENILETKSLAKQLLGELKALSSSLNTDHILHIGFVKALDNELTRLSKTKKYEVSITKTGEEYRFAAEHEIILFRLCQEILNNTVKYSKAKRVTATIIFSPTSFRLEVADDGIGFDIDLALEQVAEKGSTGLMNIKKRAHLINAEVLLNSKPNEGTSFVIIIPREQTK
ncbi:histidine kinase [Lacibacter luteus]|uniref:histidine kinase n=1 Tax=Lacibacter luteus TaxID=2508719 RepID=A0A4Q1CIW8_9BACT|nr:ATP-binding protein [Lacibacter luteus]RXK60029.1 histidine kinase [Lacibacter luteus]